MKAENGGLYEHLSGLSKAELMDRASALVRHTSVETAIQPGPRMSLLPPSCLDSLGHSHIDDKLLCRRLRAAQKLRTRMTS